MNVTRLRFPYNDAFWAVITQFLFVIIFSPGVCYFFGFASAKALLIGGLVCVLPNLYFYCRVFSHWGAQKSAQIVKAFYWGEAVKWLLTGSGFLLAFLFSGRLAAWVLGGYILAQGAFWLAPLSRAVWQVKNRQMLGNITP